MAYVDQNQSKEKTIAAVITAILIATVGYAFYTGLAMNVIKKAAEKMTVLDIKEPPPPPPKEPPPPPKEQPKVESPPIVTPPPIVQPPVVSAPPIVTTPNPVPPPVIQAPPAPNPPPAPKPSAAVKASPRGSFQSLMSTDDYPPSALRNNEAGTVGFKLEVGPDGRVTNCTVTSSSGFADLDQTACRLLQKRARFTPAKDTAGAAVSDTFSSRFTWQIPKD